LHDGKLGELVDLVSTIGFGALAPEARDVLGQVYGTWAAFVTTSGLKSRPARLAAAVPANAVTMRRHRRHQWHIGAGNGDGNVGPLCIVETCE
jgi:hypothetical protein